MPALNVKDMNPDIEIKLMELAKLLRAEVDCPNPSFVISIDCLESAPRLPAVNGAGSSGVKVDSEPPIGLSVRMIPNQRAS
jgi:hypothetical protein